MLRIALINLVPPKDAANYLGFNHGIGSISAVLKREEHETGLFNIAGPNEMVEPLKAFQPDALFVYLATNQYRLFVHELNRTWSALDAPVLVGGPHATCSPESTARLTGVSGVCVGEGEETAREAANRIEKGKSLVGAPNLWVEQEGGVVKGPAGNLVEDLDRLPFPDREIFPYEEMLKARAIHLMGFEVLCTRGCIYGCRYCINPLLRKLNGKGCVRRRSVSNVLDELREIKLRYEYNGMIGFHDDIFTLDTEWLAEFSERYPKEIGLPFWCNAHVAELSEKIVKTLRRAGCFRVHLGIECGNETIRRDLLKKRISNRDILETARLLKSHHMKMVTTFMIGLPGEVEEDLVKSVDLCRKIAPDWVLLSTFCPYPGTSLYDELVEEGRLDPLFYENLPADSFYSSALTYNQGNLSQETLDYYFENFRRMAGVAG